MMDVKFNLQSPVTLNNLYYKLLGNNKNNVNIKCGTSQKQKDDTNLIERFKKVTVLFFHFKNDKIRLMWSWLRTKINHLWHNTPSSLISCKDIFTEFGVHTQGKERHL